MPTSSVGISTRNNQRGVTLIEMLIAVVLIALVAGLSAPSVTSGLDSLRMRQASDGVIGLFNSALAHAETRQQVVEILVSPQAGALTAMTSDHKFNRTVSIPAPIKIMSVMPALSNDEQGQVRRFLIYPGGTVPKIAITIGTREERQRTISLDPITGVPQANGK